VSILWTALVTFSRGGDVLKLLPAEAAGASGWMIAIAHNRPEAEALLLRDLTQCGFVDVEVEQIVHAIAADIDDERLVANLRDLQPGKRTVWGTLHSYV
jgi:hypothetical protein